jgi:quinol monooxygenase YgiN
MPMRSTRSWWRKAYPYFSLLPMDRLEDSSLSVTRMDTQLPSTQKSQSRQRQRWTQAADRLVENLQKATEEIFRDQPGFISANLHVSRGRRKVVNYAQWRSKEDYAAMSKLPGIQAHMKAATALATGFDPVDYDLRAVMFGEREL